MASAIPIHNLAVILTNPQSQNDVEFLLVKQTRPPKFLNEEYDSYVDSDLWDLPSTQLNLLEVESGSQIVVEGLESSSEKINRSKFDIDSALNRVLEQVGFEVTDGGEWKFWKHVEEAEFGPGLPVHTVFIMAKLVAGDRNLQERCKWMSVQSCLSWLLEVKPSSDRVGPLAVVGLVNDSMHPADQKVPTILRSQEYPPGVKLVPIGSRTAKPFRTTNLIIFAPENVLNESENNSFVARGDALIVDPGCQSEFHEEPFSCMEINPDVPTQLHLMVPRALFCGFQVMEVVLGSLGLTSAGCHMVAPIGLINLQKIVAALPRKLVVFVTHHHRDHVDGLSIVQKCNPDATLLAHENTMRRIGKGDWSLGYTSVSGAEDICIGDKEDRCRQLVTNGGGEWLLWPDDGCIGVWNDDIIDESVTGGKMTPTARMITTIVDIVVGGWLTIGSWDTSTPMWRMTSNGKTNPKIGIYTKKARWSRNGCQITIHAGQWEGLGSQRWSTVKVDDHVAG
uniref:Metallo-beta-lactamase domain-containing protein n=1 Tax=Fagus sylvatica TaxID=28930 RepID=A0A2N9FPV3_FAGSY